MRFLFWDGDKISSRTHRRSLYLFNDLANNIIFFIFFFHLFAKNEKAVVVLATYYYYSRREWSCPTSFKPAKYRFVQMESNPNPDRIIFSTSQYIISRVYNLPSAFLYTKRECYPVHSRQNNSSRFWI